MKHLVLLMFISISGCTALGTKHKCVDGVLYIKADGAWIQALLYKDNKCLPEE